MNKRQNLTISKYIFLGLSILVIIWSLKAKILSPFNIYRDWNNVFACDFTETNGVVVDKSLSYVSLLNDKNEIYSIINLENDPLVSKVYDVCITENSIYIIGFNIERDGFCVLKYSLSGKNRQVVIESKKYFKDVTYSFPFDLQKEDDQLYLISYCWKNKKDTVNVMNCTELKEVIETSEIHGSASAGFSRKNNILSVIDFCGMIYNFDVTTGKQVELPSLPENRLFCSCLLDDGNFIYNDASGLSDINKLLPFVSKLNTEKINRNGKYISFYDLNSQKIKVIDTEKNEIVKTLDKSKYSPAYFIRFPLFYISLVYIICFCLCKIISFICGLIKNNEKEKIKVLVVSVLIVLGATLISIFYSVQILNLNKKSIADSVSVFSEMCINTSKYSFGKIISEIDFNEDFTKADFERNKNSFRELEQYFYEFDKAMMSGFYNEYFKIYYKTRNDYTLFFNSYGIDSGAVYLKDMQTIREETDPPEKIFGKTKIAKTPVGEFCFIRKPFKDPVNNAEYLFEFGIDYSENIKNAKKNCLQMIVTLLIIASAVYLILIELKSLFTAIQKKKMLAKENKKCSESTFVRFYSFFVYFAAEIDTIIGVLAVKEICVKNNFSTPMTAFVLSLIPFCMPFAWVVGSYLYSFLISRIQVKKLNFGTGILCAIFGLVQMAGIFTGNIALFMLAKLLFYIFHHNLFILINSISDRAETKEEILFYHG